MISLPLVIEGCIDLMSSFCRFEIEKHPFAVVFDIVRMDDPSVKITILNEDGRGTCHAIPMWHTGLNMILINYPCCSIDIQFFGIELFDIMLRGLTEKERIREKYKKRLQGQDVTEIHVTYDQQKMFDPDYRLGGKLPIGPRLGDGIQLLGKRNR